MTTESGPTKPTSFSLRRLLTVVLPLLVLAIVAFWYVEIADQQAVRGIEDWPARQFGLDNPTNNRLSDKFRDEDGDLVADRPTEDQCVSPDPLLFSYIPGDDQQQQADAWQGLMDAIAEASGRRVEFKHVVSVDEQLRALATGELHITGVNTGAVPRAVNSGGFVPMFALGDADGTFGYTMKIIVPPDSPIQQIRDLQETRITFTTADSNSGFKAPVVMLMYDYDLKVGRDYDFGFSTSHEESIRLVAENEVAVATVASDMLDRAVSLGDVQRESIREIYTSERFPSAALGCAHNLTAELSDKISQAIADYSLAGTALPTNLGLPEDAKFVPVSYKDEWAVVRRTDDALGVIHAPIEEAGTE